MDHSTPAQDDNTVYQRIKQLLVTYAFFPGDRLQVPELADQLRVSATPVREALNRFCAEGLLTAVPHRGFFVKKLDQNEIGELYAMKHMLLSYAARDTLSALTLDEAEQGMLSHLAGISYNTDRAGSIDLYERCSVPMILLVGSLAGNTTLLACLNNVLDKLQFVRQTEVHMEDRSDEVLQEAAAMAQALLSGREDDLQTCLDDQLAREQSMLQSLMKECVNRLYLRSQAPAARGPGERRVKPAATPMLGRGPSA